MRKAFFFNIALVIIFLTFSQLAFARSGCCSHHQGVCGCGCCDGTPLSSTCAPYYSECNRPAQIEEKPIYILPTATPYPTSTPYPTYTPTPTKTPTPFPIKTNTPKPTKKIVKPTLTKSITKKSVTKQTKKSFWQWLFGK